VPEATISQSFSLVDGQTGGLSSVHNEWQFEQRMPPRRAALSSRELCGSPAPSSAGIVNKTCCTSFGTPPHLENPTVEQPTLNYHGGDGRTDATVSGRLFGVPQHMLSIREEAILAKHVCEGDTLADREGFIAGVGKLQD
jgi:hypothetical protein